MDTVSFNAEPLIRVTIFALVLLVMMVWEALAARRPRALPRTSRWPANLLIVLLDTAVVRLFFPLAAVGIAIHAQSQDWGLFNQLELPLWLTLLLSLLLMDMAIYWQHRVFHAVPLLWRLHRMHHADQDIDVTTALRFHPVEILLSMLIKMVVVILLGAPPLAVMIFEILLNATAMFNHANVRLPTAIDRWLRLIVVTPDMHRVHHSIYRQETDSNFGFNLPWWDRLFGSYRAQPQDGHLDMTIGLEQFRTLEDQRLGRTLMQPLRRD